jgi:hypothetical protein
MRKPKRKPCPYCKSLDAFVERYELAVYGVVCNNCLAIGPKVEHGKYYDDPDGAELAERDATRMWNARTPAAYQRVKTACEM